MVVRLKVAMAGKDVSYAPGDLYSCDDASAARLIAAEYAETIAREAPVERSVLMAPERATKRRGA